jgi:N-acetylneuraminate synthase
MPLENNNHPSDQIPAIRLGSKVVGPGKPCYVVAEIGINHNGDIDLAKRLITVAAAAGCDAVKFQKRTPIRCVPPNQRDIPRETPWGILSYLEYREKIEFGAEEYARVDAFCKNENLDWFVSCWDEESVAFMDRFDPPCYKIASASLTDDSLLRCLRERRKPLILSTGMSSLEEIDHAVETLGTKDLLLMHSVSTYPAYYEELNLRVIPLLQERYGVPVGYSGHETGLPSSIVAVALGACMVERHITLDRALWGSDHAASLEPNGITRLVRDIRLVEKSMGDGIKKVLPREVPIRERLRRVQSVTAT